MILSMIAVVIVTRSVLYDRSNPDGSETKRLDIVELVNDTLEVTSPARVLGTLLCFLVVLAEHIVTWITIVETSGHHEIDTFISEICTINREVISRHRIRRGKKQQHRCKELLLKLSHKKNIKLRYLVKNYLFAKLIRKRWNCKQTSLYSLFFICKRLHLQVKKTHTNDCTQKYASFLPKTCVFKREK